MLMRLLRLRATRRCSGLSDRQNNRGEKRSHFVLLRREDCEVLAGFIRTSWQRMRFLGVQLDDGSVSQRRAAKLDVKPQNDPLHNYHDRVALSWWFLVHCPSLSCFLFSSAVRWWLRVRPVEGEMLLEGQWGKAAEDRPAYVATAPSIGENRKGVVRIRAFKVVPTQLRHPPLSILTARRRAEPRAAASHPHMQRHEASFHYFTEQPLPARWCSD